MGVVRYIAKRRFNYIDCVTVACMTSVAGNGWLVLGVFFVGVILSAVAETVTGQP